MTRRLVLVAAALAALLGLAFAVVWFVPGVQDALIKRGMVGAPGFSRACGQPVTQS